MGADVVYIGDLGGIFHAVSVETGKALWTFKTATEIKSSPVVVGDIVLIGSYDGHLYAARCKTGAVKWKVLTMGQVHATPAVRDGLAFIAGCDSVFRAIRVADGREAYRSNLAPIPAHRRFDDGRAYFGTFNNEVLALDLARRSPWRFADPERKFPFYASAALSGETSDRRRTRQDDSRPRREHGPSDVDVRHARTRRFLTSDCRRPCLHRLERRTALRARRATARRFGVRRRRRPHRLPRHRHRPGRHRRRGRHRSTRVDERATYIARPGEAIQVQLRILPTSASTRSRGRTAACRAVMSPRVVSAVLAARPWNTVPPG